MELWSASGRNTESDGGGAASKGAIEGTVSDHPTLGWMALLMF